MQNDGEKMTLNLWACRRLHPCIYVHLQRHSRKSSSSLPHKKKPNRLHLATSSWDSKKKLVIKTTWISACIYRHKLYGDKEFSCITPRSMEHLLKAVHAAIENLDGTKGNKSAKPDLPRQAFRSCHLNSCLSQAISCWWSCLWVCAF